MGKYSFEIIFGLVLAVLFIAFCLWQTPGLLGEKLTQKEIDHHIAACEKQLNIPEKAQILKRIREWAEDDDGKPVHMLNLMRHYPELLRYPGAPDFQGSPEEANRYYEDKTVDLILKSGSAPLFMSTSQGKTVVGFDQDVDKLNRVLVVRYTSRRAFLKLLSDPLYADICPYKFMSMEINILPLTGDVVLPDLRLALGSFFLLLFLAVGWYRSARRS
jgi:hypothetical protein